MASDQYILHKCKEEDILYVRFYSWVSPTITLGYMQNARETLLLDKMKNDSISWIRRPTGGRAVLHWGDLTYSCIFPKTISLMGTSIKESYAVITRCLIDGLNRAGIECHTHDSYDQFLAVKREKKLPCFLAPNRDEIMVQGRKFVGSAQKRASASVLQHGSIPLTTDFYKLPEYLSINIDEQSEQKLLLRAKSICLHEITTEIQICELVEFLKCGFFNVLQLPGGDKNWEEDELQEIQRIAASMDFVHTWMNQDA
jgi:lipoate-protein ligase A